MLVRFAHAVEDALDRVEDASCLSMSEGEAADAVLALTRAQARIAELRLRTLAQADARDVARQDASASTGAWLAHQTRQTRPGAFADVKLAKALAGEFQATRAALAAGVVVEEQARVIVRAVRALGPGVSEQTRRAGERFLLERAQEFDAAALAVMGRHLFEVLDPEEADRRLGRKLAEEARAAARKTFLQLHDNGDGTSSGRFKIPALTASQLLKMLEAILAPRHQRAARKADGGRVVHPDRHPLGADDWQRRHDARVDGEDGEAAEKADAERERRLLTRPERLGRALCALVERFPADRLPQLGGLNATVVVTMTLEQLRGRAGGRLPGRHRGAGLGRRRPAVGVRGRDHPRGAWLGLRGAGPGPGGPAAHRPAADRAGAARQGLHRRGLHQTRLPDRGAPQDPLVPGRAHQRPGRGAAVPLAPPPRPRPPLRRRIPPHRNDPLPPTHVTDRGDGTPSPASEVPLSTVSVCYSGVAPDPTVRGPRREARNLVSAGCDRSNQAVTQSRQNSLPSMSCITRHDSFSSSAGSSRTRFAPSATRRAPSASSAASRSSPTSPVPTRTSR